VGLGLPLFAMLDQDELASVVAHEFGHHTAGDVALGPWLYGTRLAIGTALERLEGSAFWLHLPFVAYGNLFLRITRSTSREQELSADRLAASCFGAASTATALLRVNDIDMTWPVYWDGEVIPVLERSRLPRVLEGFERFTAELEKRPKVVEDLARLKRESRQEASKPLDTHPSLRERLIALGTPDAASRRGARSSLQLFDDVAVAEKQIIQSILRDPNMPLEAFEWDAAAEAVWLPSWMDTIGPYREMFARIPPSAIPDALADAARWAPLLRAGVAFLSPQAERKRLSGLLGVHLAVRLHELGFTFTCAPGAAPSASKDGASVEPFVVVSDLEKGELSAADWKATCAKIGLD